MPREEISMRDCTPEELAEIAKARQEFFDAKAASKIMTPYGMQYSPHYQRQSRAQKT